ncbi:small secreted protein [Streptomyces sp. BI20]|uniref:small secreted protein n=1 Tax=Streptomyces sp. BI20 TaxID=3403460 RepID=UPI003C75AB64
MKKKANRLTAALTGGAVLALVLTGCGGGDEDAEAKKKTDAWAKTVCDAWKPEVEKIRKAEEDIKKVSGDATKPEEVKTADSAAFGNIAAAYKALGAAVTNAGVPPVSSGKSAQTEAVGKFDKTSQGYTALKTRIDALDTKDQAKFAKDLGEIAKGIDPLVTEAKSGFEQLDKAGLSAAMNAQPGCKDTAPAKS